MHTMDGKRVTKAAGLVLVIAVVLRRNSTRIPSSALSGDHHARLAMARPPIMQAGARHVSQTMALSSKEMDEVSAQPHARISLFGQSSGTSFKPSRQRSRNAAWKRTSSVKSGWSVMMT